MRPRHIWLRRSPPEPRFRSPGVERIRRKGRVLTLLTSEGPEHVVNEARGLNPVSIDVTPLSLKDIFLETVVGEE